jgi:pre-60S factor REI1
VGLPHSRYNLKRRIASLPPITSELFNEKVLQARAASAAEADKAYFEQSCEACQRTYQSEKSYQNHLSSQKHKHNVIAMAKRKGTKPIDDEAGSMISSTFSLGEPLPTSKGEDVDSDAEKEFNEMVEGLTKTDLKDRSSPVKRPSNPHLSAVGQRKEDHPVSDSPQARESESSTPIQSKGDQKWPLEACLFCNYTSPTIQLNMHHMERFHGMFVPEKQYLVDLDGLLKLLQQRVHEAHQCLYCGKEKSNAFAVQTHMRDTGHCKIPYTTEEEQLDIGDFYDFRSTYSDGEDSDEENSAEDGPNGGAKLGAPRKAKITGPDGEDIKEGEDDGWETDSSASSLDSADLTAVPAEAHYHQYERLGKHPHHSHNDPRHHHQADGWHSHAHKHTHAAFYDDYELHLPSGKSVGHRSLNRYYRQNLHNYPTAEERAERLAIEAAKEDDSDDEGKSPQVGNEGRGRAIVRRDAAGMLGVTVQNRKSVQRAEVRGRKLENHHSKRKQWNGQDTTRPAMVHWAYQV